MTKLKGKEPQQGYNPQPTCFVSSAAGGFAFHLKGGVQIYALHSFLMRIEMKSDKEVCFYYTYGTVRVMGPKVELIYTMAVPRVLGGAQPSAPNDPCLDEVEVKEVIFEETKIEVL